MAKYTFDEAWNLVTPNCGTEVTVSLTSPTPRTAPLLLRANVPSTVMLTGPADLLFARLTAVIRAEPLMRNLADPRWGTARSSLSGDTVEELLLTAPARLLGAGIRKSTAGTVTVKAKDAGQFVTLAALTATAQDPGAYHTQAFQTDTIRFEGATAADRLLVLSPSLPTRVTVAIGDDTPLQVFPSEMGEGDTVASRDLAGTLNAFWRRSAVPDGTAAVRMRLTSMTDALITVELDGAWGRTYDSPLIDLPLTAGMETTVNLPWTMPETGEATLRLSGRLDGGRRLGLTGTQPTFAVRVTDRLEVAQAFRLAAGTRPGQARQLTAVWLRLPDLPADETTLELRLTEAEGDPAVPSDQPLQRFPNILPADAAAYVAEGGSYWYRAPFPRPVPLDGIAVNRPLFVVAAGKGSSALLCHTGQGALSGAPGRLPASGGAAGRALVRNWLRTGTWEDQFFNQEAALWLIDVEVQPLPAEYASLVTADVGGAGFRPVPLAGPREPGREVGPFPVNRGTAVQLPVRVRSASSGRLTARVSVYQPVGDASR